MSNYEFIKQMDEWRGEARLYRNTITKSHVIVSRASTFDRGDETMIFPYNKREDVVDWCEVYAGYGEDHETALRNFEGEL